MQRDQLEQIYSTLQSLVLGQGGSTSGRKELASASVETLTSELASIGVTALPEHGVFVADGETYSATKHELNAPADVGDMVWSKDKGWHVIAE